VQFTPNRGNHDIVHQRWPEAFHAITHPKSPNYGPLARNERLHYPFHKAISR
jgi:hypothetical protein